MRRAALTLAVVALMAGAARVSARPETLLVTGQRLPAEVALVDADGAATRLETVVARAGPASALRLVRIQAEWCGTCAWQAGDTGRLLGRFGDRIRVVDVVVADRDNRPATAETVRAWRSRLPAAVAVAADAEQRLIGAIPPPAPLPWMLLVDGRTLTLRERLTNPDPQKLTEAIEQAIGRSRHPGLPEAFGGVFTRDQFELIRAMRLPPQPPADPTNRVADTPAAAELGRRIFTDRSLSPSGRVACISCHSPELVFTNGKDTAAEGVGPGNRNVPSMVLASHARWQLWDGRADSLWAQAVLPFEDATEFGSSRLFVAHAVFDRHRSDYEPIFGPLPPLDDAGRFPANGKPGDAAWEAMSPADREAVTRVLANVGKSIAAFERSLRVKPNALDRYADGDAAALTAPQKAGLRAFFDAGCAQCHHGPRLTDDAFHNLRLPTGRADKAADRGRADGIPRLLSSEFLRSGRFSDAAGPPPPGLPTSTGETGAFKTPGLRGVPFTMPYGHGGGFGGLASVIEAHRTGGLPAGGRFAAGDAEPWARGFDPALAAPIEAFLRTLSLDVEDPGLPQSPDP